MEESTSRIGRLGNSDWRSNWEQQAKQNNKYPPESIAQLLKLKNHRAKRGREPREVSQVAGNLLSRGMFCSQGDWDKDESHTDWVG